MKPFFLSQYFHVLFIRCCVFLAIAGVMDASLIAAETAGLGRQMQNVLGESHLSGGVLVFLIRGDQTLPLSLLKNEAFIVQRLVSDPKQLGPVRERLQSQGVYGRVSVDQFDGRHLPYIDNSVNFVSADKEFPVADAEIMRVLAPGGVALVETDSKDPGTIAIGSRSFVKHVKQRPKAIDEWTHFLHGPDNNAVAHDDVVGPPRRLQWLGSPKYSRHHDRMSSVSAIVTAGGRVFQIIDEAPPISIFTAPDWRLVARDAFNGKILWRREIGTWDSHLHGLKSGPADLPRKLVAVGDRVYVTLALGDPVTVLDAATGRTVATLEDTANTEELIISDGLLLAQVNDELLKTRPVGMKGPSKTTITVESPDKRIGAIDIKTGKTVWKYETPVLWGTLAADGSHVVFMAQDHAVCLDQKTGRELWRSQTLPVAEKYPMRFTPTLVLYDDVVLFASGETAAMGNRSWSVGDMDTLTALDGTTGKVLWEAPHPHSGYASAEDVLVTNGTVWSGETTSGHAVGTFTGRNVKTGQVVAQFDPDVDTYWFHHRCYRGKATDKYLLMSRTGVEFIDVEKHSWQINHWVRGACLYGVMPANGLLYAAQHPCACYLETKMSGFTALAPANATPAPAIPDSARLTKGPAFDAVTASDASADDWPTMRHDAARSGRASTSVPANVKADWDVALGGRLSRPIVADGHVFVASVDTHSVHAIDAESGKRIWEYTTGGRVDSPPTYWKGRVLFGSADGSVYCLRASDGALVWRFFAASSDRRTVAVEQLESLWPVHGSVLIHQDVLYFVAGRSIFLDGGLVLYRMNPATGDVLSTTAMNEHDAQSGHDVQDFARQQNMPVGLPDVLSCDGKKVYMRSQPFELDGTRLPLEALPYAGNPERYSVPPTQKLEYAHIFSPTGFLDDTWWHRTYWIYGSRFLGGWAGYSQAGKVTPGGRILTTDDTTVYGFGRLPQYYRWTTPIEHQLFAAAKDASTVEQKIVASRRQKKGKGSQVAYLWSRAVPLFARAMVLADDSLFIAGPEDIVDEQAALRQFDDEAVKQAVQRQREAFDGKHGGLLWAVSSKTGDPLDEVKLDTIPTFDGMVAARGRLYFTSVDGRLICFAGKKPSH